MSMLGKTLGNFEITAPLGHGGMGEVYQAKDRKLGRDVAIKVLPKEFTRDADRIARFQREAKLLASLNHPNIAAIHELEESDGTNFLVLELVGGETLADRLKRASIPVEESLKLSLQIAEALEAAHERGVIHRDLKPANIKVTPEGKVKVLDFGLAKAFAGEQADLNLSNSPTLTYSPTLSDAATRQGVILGTAAYMPPEQARGKAVDKRADIWSFGCVLYEMLTGQAAFQGEDVTEILAAVVKGGANLDLLPANLHPRVREVITRCLQKDLKRRYHGIADVRYEIEQALADPNGVLVQPVTTETRRRLGTILPWVAVTAILSILVAGVAVWNLRKPTPLSVIRFDYEPPADQQFNNGMAVSPNGKQFVYSTNKGLYLRSMDELRAKFIAGTEGGIGQPFFSPDGKWIGFFSVVDRKLKKIAIEGGEPIVLCAIENGGFVSGEWSEDNTIVYGQVPGSIMRISAKGGTPETLIKSKSWALGLPQILPDGKSILYVSVARPDDPNSLKIMVHSPKTGEPKELLSGVGARYLPTGHIVYLLGKTNTLCAIPFDVDRLEVTGESVRLIEGVKKFDVYDGGMLAYAPSANAASDQRILVWVDRQGKEEQLAAEPKDYSYFQISPDGTRVALTVKNEEKGDIYIWDFVRQNMMKLTLDEAGGGFPLWTPDSKKILFASGRKDAFGIYCKAADDTGEVELLNSLSDLVNIPSSWSADGKDLVIWQTKPGGSNPDIGTLPMEGGKIIKLLLQRKYQEAVPQISPDGRWMAYSSDESGQLEVYVCPFPNVNNGKWKVSTSGGLMQLWSKDGRELLYWADNKMMAAVIEPAPTFKPGIPKVLFERPPVVSNYWGTIGIPWDISPDGKRFLMLKSIQQTEDTHAAYVPRPKINIVLNWIEELKQRMPAK
jgi:eukaryotic-like serine/threonine-protein kinase